MLLIVINLALIPRAVASLEQLQLPSLTDNTTVSMTDFRGKVLLLSFFEPDCPWCYRQMKVFNQTQAQCNEQLQPLSVGIRGTDQKLRPELRRAKVSYPAVRGTPLLLRLVGEIPATPWTLIFDPQGQLLGTWRGYMKFKQVQSLFPEFCPPPESPLG
ncbi:MAG TPA: hypothetical protein DIT58_06780 [Porticoccaceae bacterium]|nr:hypothetical protein [Porticoccaceae bacterium]